jgi:hypothetical protein
MALSSFDPLLAHNPDLLRQLVEQALGRLGRSLHRPTPPASLTLGQPLASGHVVVPLQYEFCATCGLDLLSNPGALVTRLTTESVTVQCDCGAPAHDLPAWMWR